MLDVGEVVEVKIKVVKKRSKEVKEKRRTDINKPDGQTGTGIEG